MDRAILETIAIAGGLAGVECRDDFAMALERQWRMHERSGRPLSLLVVDIDFYRQFQNVCDIVASDECLDAVASAILESVRRPGSQVFAWAAGSFAVLLPETNVLEAERVAEEIRFQAGALVIPHPRSPLSQSVTVSLGLASARPAAGITPLSLTRDAELALTRNRTQSAERWSGTRRRQCATT